MVLLFFLGAFYSVNSAKILVEMFPASRGLSRRERPSASREVEMKRSLPVRSVQLITLCNGKVASHSLLKFSEF